MDSTNTSPVISSKDGRVILEGDFVAMTVHEAERQRDRVLSGSEDIIDGAGVGHIDTSGAVLILRLAGDRQIEGFDDNARAFLDMVRQYMEQETPPETRRKIPFLEAVGDWGYRTGGRLFDIISLTVEVTFWSFVDIFNRRQYRKGTFTEQAYFMGSTALSIVGTILFLIGVILTLQSAAQLRQFGVTIFVVNLLAIGLSREFAPLMTAIIVSGRSGSAIASEIATMKFTEELDAIRTLGLNPLRFVVVPKMWAMVVCLPLLTVMALFIGILGGFAVAITYMQLTPAAFFNQLISALMFWDIITGLIKSVSFAIIITIVGTYQGLHFSGGADGVGRATTASVVASIFAIIVVDSIWGIIFYFGY